MKSKQIHKDLTASSLYKGSPADVLTQVNHLNDYIRDIEQGIFKSPTIDHIESLDNLLRTVAYIMEFEKPEGSNFFSGYEMPDFTKPVKKTTKKGN